MDKQTFGYQTYVLRMWREKPHGTWRAMVQLVPNGEWIAFNTLDKLFSFLVQRSTYTGGENQTPSSL